MKNDYIKNQDKLASVEAGLKSLLRYNRAMWISVKEDKIDTTLVEHYFTAEEGSEEEIQLEKQIGAAVVCACYDDHRIPNINKVRAARKIQRQFLDSVRGAKTEYLYASGKLGVPIRAEKERMRRLKELAIVNKAQMFDRIYKIFNRKSQRTRDKAMISVAIGHLTSSDVVLFTGTQIGSLALGFVSDKYKEKIKQKANDACEKTVNTINANIERFKETPIGRKVTTVIKEKVAPVINRGVEIAAKVGNKIKEKISHGWTALKSFFA